ncbi:MAG: DUF2207 domain-containing protein, partial [Alphaproteobacteria bacterium]
MALRLLLVFFALIAIVASNVSAHAQAADTVERITAYSSDITIGRDGTLIVGETISVNAQRNQIQRGIFRDFPTN